MRLLLILTMVLLITGCGDRRQGETLSNYRYRKDAESREAEKARLRQYHKDKLEIQVLKEKLKKLQKDNEGK